MARPRVLLADDHKILVEGLRGLLEPEFDLLATVEDGRELVERALELMPDVIIADVSMPLLNGIEATRQILPKAPKIRVVFLTMHADVAYANEAFRAGASGYILKRSAAGELVTAIREALNGGVYVTPSVARAMMNDTFGGKGLNQSGPRDALTNRQREVLQLVAEDGRVPQVPGDGAVEYTLDG